MIPGLPKFGQKARNLAPFLAAMAAFVGPSAAQSFDDVESAYREYLDRPSLFKRTLGRHKLAATRDPRALEILVKDYARPEDPEQVNRYLIADIAMRAFGARADRGVLGEWRLKYDDPEDSWLWFTTLEPTAVEQFDFVRETVTGRHDPFIRFAALEATASRVRDVNSPDGLPLLCEELLADLPRKDVERALATEGVAGVILGMKSKVRSDPWKDICSRLIDQLDDEDTPERTKVVISRHLAQTFGVSNLGLDSYWWRSELERRPQKEVREGATTTVPFFSVRTFGYRFVYVIDASDSMLARVTDREKKDLGPTTGRPKPKDEGESGFVPDADDIDWARVITRFDAAREYLRLSLSSLSKEHSFAVVLFGDEARCLDATPKLIRATPGAIRKVLAELNDIEPGPKTDRRPLGQLRGQTNLHAGFRKAFEVTTRGEVRGAEYVDPKGMIDGCDTIFVLSDGAPSWDDFGERDSRDPEDQAGDPETGRTFENVPTLLFQGPYARGGLIDGPVRVPYELLVRDVRRMNMFRRAEIHCVGIGEANHQLLESLADIGLGQALRVEGEK